VEALTTLGQVLAANGYKAVTDMFVSPGLRIYWAWLLASAVLGAVVWLRVYRRVDDDGTARGFLRFLFPRDVYLHPSARVDYGVYLTNAVLFRWTLTVAPVVATTTAFATALRLDRWLGSSGDMFVWHGASLAGFTLASALATDFATYLVHAAHHRIPLLWEFHRVHHTAEVLTPLTVYRKHPVYDLFAGGTRGLLAGLLQGVAAYAFIGRPDLITLLGINAVFAAFHVAGSNLRHTHIWLAFWPWLSRLLISPAQHQVHHSTAERHWNKNYGEVFAVWDWMFGTLYVPAERESLTFGVMGTDHQEHASVWDAYMVPLVNAGLLLTGRRPQ
jgi:sterol desaturase/sphingolipid hydroxylase (fatty acid hydroxylase superfamily)